LHGLVNMENALYVFNSVLPILILLWIGQLLCKYYLFTPETVDNIKKFIVNFSLPAVLFTSFLDIAFEWNYLLLMVLVFLLCVLLYLYGRLTKKIFQQPWIYFPFLLTGFEFGMLGLSLFGSAYGLENFGKMAILGVPHEFFIWFVYVTLLVRETSSLPSVGSLLKSFLSSPVIIAIFASILLNLTGLASWLTNAFFADGLFKVLNLLAGLTAPLILLVIGYDIKITRNNIKSSVLVVLLRLGLLTPLALLINHYILAGLFNLDHGFQIAFFTLLILPPPFIIPIFMKKDLTEEKAFITNTLMLHTVASIVVFIIYFALNPSL
jgi:malate permease and related proteins